MQQALSAGSLARPVAAAPSRGLLHQRHTLLPTAALRSLAPQAAPCQLSARPSPCPSPLRHGAGEQLQPSRPLLCCAKRPRCDPMKDPEQYDLQALVMRKSDTGEALHAEELLVLFGIATSKVQCIKKQYRNQVLSIILVVEQLPGHSRPGLSPKDMRELRALCSSSKYMHVVYRRAAAGVIRVYIAHNRGPEHGHPAAGAAAAGAAAAGAAAAPFSGPAQVTAGLKAPAAAEGVAVATAPGQRDPTRGRRIHSQDEALACAQALLQAARRLPQVLGPGAPTADEAACVGGTAVALADVLQLLCSGSRSSRATAALLAAEAESLVNGAVAQARGVEGGVVPEMHSILLVLNDLIRLRRQTALVAPLPPPPPLPPQQRPDSSSGSSGSSGSGSSMAVLADALEEAAALLEVALASSVARAMKLEETRGKFLVNILEIWLIRTSQATAAERQAGREPLAAFAAWFRDATSPFWLEPA